MVTDCAAKHGIADIQRVENGANRGRTFHIQLHGAVDARKRSQVRGKLDSDHVRSFPPGLQAAGCSLPAWRVS